VIKFFAMLDTPVWVIIVTLLIIYILSLRRRMAGLNDPRLWLSRKERRAVARKELAQRDEERDLAQFQRNLDIVQGTTTHKENQ
jgi:hypothetical protein